MSGRGKSTDSEDAGTEALEADFDAEQTRTERTRAAAEVNQLAIALTQLTPDQLDRLALPERVREEVDVCRGLKPRGRGRQNRLIGQLLRAEDHESIRHRFERLNQDLRSGVAHEKRNEGWRTRLLEEGDTAVEALLVEHPEGDRQRLRLLVRSARQLPASPRTRRAYRELLRTIRALRS